MKNISLLFIAVNTLKMKLNKLSAPRVRRVVKCFALFAAALAMFVMLPAFATMQSKSVIKTGNVEQPTRELFSFIGSRNSSSTASIAAVREQAINIEFGEINFESAKELKIPLLDGISYTAVRTDSEGFVRQATDEFTWRGKISGENNWSGDVILTVKEKSLSGLIYSPTAVYEVIPQANFAHLLVELDQSRFPDSSEVALPSAHRGGASIVKRNALEESALGGNTLITRHFQNDSIDSPQLDDGSLIDVLVVYTAAVRNALGGAAQAQAVAQQSVASTNAAYQNSGITTRLRLVQTMEVNYADNGNGEFALNWVRTNATVATARNTAKADLVSMLTENVNDVCGIAYVYSPLIPDFAPLAFSVVQRSCAGGNLAFAHELGHNQGCEHNPENAGTPAYPYSYGHWSTIANFITVMSYDNPCPGCPRIPNFSNPSVFRSGVATGIANQRENARTINNTALTVSRFRDSGGGSGGGVQTQINVGQTINGALATSDCVNAGRYYDKYTFSGTGGQQISIAQNSTFDTYLYLLNSSGQIIAEDDDGGGGTNSRIPATSGFFTLPATGTYSIWASSYSANQTGAYTVSLIAGTSPPTTRKAFDFDGDGKSDVSVFRPSNGMWYILQSQNGLNFVPFGQYGDRIAPADYDGDGRTDVAVFRGTVPGAGNSAYFYITNSSNNSFVPVQFGATGDVPVSGDWDADGKADLAVYRDGSLTGGQSYFFYRPSSQPVVNYYPIALGAAGDKPLVGDFDGDRRLDAAVFRPSNGTWHILRSSTNQVVQQTFGLSTDIPTPADFDGDGMTNIAVFRPSNGTWFTSTNPQFNYGAVQFGANGDIPVPADYDGDGKADVAVFRPSNGAWYLNRSTQGFTGVAFGSPEDKPIPNAFIR